MLPPSSCFCDLRFSPQALSLTLWSLARLGHPPPSSWLSKFQAATSAACTSSPEGLPPRALTTTLAGLALLGPAAAGKVQQLDPNWVAVLLEWNRTFLKRYRAQELSQVVASLARLNPLGVSSKWKSDFLSACLTLMTQPVAAAATGGGGSPDVTRCDFTPTQLATLLWSLAVLQVAPAKSWLAVALEVLQPQLGSLTLQSKCGLVWSLTVLQPEVPRVWWKQLLDVAFQQGLPEQPTACAQVLFCISSLDNEYLQVRWGEKHNGFRFRISGPQRARIRSANHLGLCSLFVGK